MSSLLKSERKNEIEVNSTGVSEIYQHQASRKSNAPRSVESAERLVMLKSTASPQRTTTSLLATCHRLTQRRT